jgi:hypothetical protein
MNKITIIVRTTLLDESQPPFDYKEIKICKDKTIAEAKEIVLNELKNDFKDLDSCNTLEEAAKEMIRTWDYSVYCDNDTFSWEENCKGKTYEFKEIDLDSNGYQIL